MRWNRSVRVVRAVLLSAAVVGVMFAWSSGVSAAPINTGLVAGYGFNGDADDESGNEHHGVVHGATLTTDRFGNPNSAYSFDGNSDITLTSLESQLSTGFTISLWVNRDGSDPWDTLVHKTQVSPPVSSVGLYITPEDRSEIYVSSDGSIVNRAYRASEAQIAANEWVHLAFVYEPSARQDTFINGQLSNGLLTGSIQSNFLDGDQPFVLGHNYTPGNWDRGLRASLDEVYFYDRVLSASEIATLATVPEPNTALLLGVGLVGLGMKRRTRRGC